MDHLQNWLGEGSLPVMRGLQLADKLQAELNAPNIEAKKTCFTEEILGRLLEIVNTLNDGINKLYPLLPQENAPLKQATHHHDKSAHLTSSVKDLKHSPRKLKRYLPKFPFKVQGRVPEDGYTWRKYGQKMILNRRHPRSYYKCFYKGDLNCPALKQVQRCDDDASCFDIIYIGKHTCEWTCKGHHTQSHAVSPLLSSHTSCFHRTYIGKHTREWTCEGQNTQNHAVSPLVSPSQSNSYASSSSSTQELNMGNLYVEPSLKICEIESEEEVQNNGITSTTMNRLYSLMELQEMLIADSYSFPQANMEQPQEGYNSGSLPDQLMSEQLFPAFADFEREL